MKYTTASHSHFSQTGVYPKTRISIMKHYKDKKLMRGESGELDTKIFALNKIVFEMVQR